MEDIKNIIHFIKDKTTFGRKSTFLLSEYKISKNLVEKLHEDKFNKDAMKIIDSPLIEVQPFLESNNLKRNKNIYKSLDQLNILKVNNKSLSIKSLKSLKTNKFSSKSVKSEKSLRSSSETVNLKGKSNKNNLNNEFLMSGRDLIYKEDNKTKGNHNENYDNTENNSYNNKILENIMNKKIFHDNNDDYMNNCQLHPPRQLKIGNINLNKDIHEANSNYDSFYKKNHSEIPLFSNFSSHNSNSNGNILNKENTHFQANDNRKFRRFINIYDSFSEDENYIKDLIPNWYSINPFGYFYKFWHVLKLLLITFILIYNSTVLIYSGLSDVNFPLVILINILIDIFFIINLIIYFLTGVKTSPTESSFRLSRIIKNILFIPIFYCDLTLAFPYNIYKFTFYKSKISLYGNIHPFSYDFNYLIRLLSFLHIIDWIKLTYLYKGKNKYLAKLLKGDNKFSLFLQKIQSYFYIFGFLIILIHILSSLFLYIGIKSSQFYLNTWISEENSIFLSDKSLFDLYISSLYYIFLTLLTIGYGDITPKNQQEMTFSILLMLVGCFLYSYLLILGTIMIGEKDIKSKIISERQLVLINLSREFNLTKSLYNKLNKFILKKNYLNWNNSLSNFLDSLPNLIKNNISISMFKQIIENLVFFKEKHDRYILFIVPLLKTFNYDKNELIWSVGENIRDMLFVVNGKLSLNLGEEYNNLNIYDIGKTFHFGEVNMFMDDSISNYNLLVKNNNCKTFSLSKSDFLVVMNEFPEEIKEILTHSLALFRKIEKKRLIAIKYYNRNQSFKGFDMFLYKNDEFRSFITDLKDEISFDEETINLKNKIDSGTKISKTSDNIKQINSDLKIDNESSGFGTTSINIYNSGYLYISEDNDDEGEENDENISKNNNNKRNDQMKYSLINGYFCKNISLKSKSKSLDKSLLSQINSTNEDKDKNNFFLTGNDYVVIKSDNETSKNGILYNKNDEYEDGLFIEKAYLIKNMSNNESCVNLNKRIKQKKEFKCKPTIDDNILFKRIHSFNELFGKSFKKKGKEKNISMEILPNPNKINEERCDLKVLLERIDKKRMVYKKLTQRFKKYKKEIIENEYDNVYKYDGYNKNIRYIKDCNNNNININNKGVIYKYYKESKIENSYIKINTSKKFYEDEFNIYERNEKIIKYQEKDKGKQEKPGNKFENKLEKQVTKEERLSSNYIKKLCSIEKMIYKNSKISLSTKIDKIKTFTNKKPIIKIPTYNSILIKRKTFNLFNHENYENDVKTKPKNNTLLKRQNTKQVKFDSPLNEMNNKKNSKQKTISKIDEENSFQNIKKSSIIDLNLNRIPSDFMITDMKERVILEKPEWFVSNENQPKFRGRSTDKNKKRTINNDTLQFNIDEVFKLNHEKKIESVLKDFIIENQKEFDHKRKTYTPFKFKERKSFFIKKSESQNKTFIRQKTATSKN